MTGCQSDNLDYNPNNGEEGEGAGYMAFTISTETLTRAADSPNWPGDWTDDDDETFNNGEPREYALAPNTEAHAVFFFDNSGTFYGLSYLTPYDESNDNHDFTHDDQYPEHFYTYITRWRDSKAIEPTQALVLMNVEPNALASLNNKFTSMTLSQILQVLNTQDGQKDLGIYTMNGNVYFTMSNSIFVDGDSNIVTATNIQGHVYSSREEALKNRAIVYVERMLAKHSVTFNDQTLTNDNSIILNPFEDADNQPAKVYYVENYSGTGESVADLDYPTYTEIEWRANIVNWGMNALEPEAKIFKDIETGKTQYFADWTNYTYHRSYWGLSPNYSTDDSKFPTQYRSLVYDPENLTPAWGGSFVGATTGTFYEGNDLGNPNYCLRYISFNDMNIRAPHHYTLPRTYETKEGLMSYGPYRYATHVLIGAQLLFGDESELTTKGANGTYKDQTWSNSNALSGVADKYYAYGYFWANKESYIRFAYHRMVSDFAAQGSEVTITDILDNTKSPVTVDAIDGVLYAIDGGNNYVAITPDKADQYFTTEQAYLTHGDGKITLRANDKYEDGGIFYAYLDDKGERQFARLTKGQLIDVIYRYAEEARHFTQGMMYYAIPIQHKLGKTLGETVKIDKDATEYALGQFGVVRNHWYRLNIKTIGNIGIPVDDPDQPIIPDPEDEYSIALEIVVLPWHVIDMGDVDL